MATVNDYTRTTWQTGDVIDATKMNNIETQLDAVTDNARDNGTAPVFSTTKTYAVGEHVLYNGEVYRCKTAVTNAGAWVANNWVKAYLSSDMEGEVSELKSALDELSGYKVKNIFPDSWADRTSNGITWHKNEDGSVKLTGTATYNEYQTVTFPVTAGDYILSGCPQGGSAQTYHMMYTSPITGNTAYEVGVPRNLTFAQDQNFSVSIRVMKNTVLPEAGVVFFPMLRDASISDETYVPYNVVDVVRSVAEISDEVDNSIQKEDMAKYAGAEFTVKNLLPNNLTNQAINGLTVNINDDKTVTISGTATAQTALGMNVALPAGNYAVTGAPAGSSSSTYHIMFNKPGASSTSFVTDNMPQQTFTVESATSLTIYMRVMNRQTVDVTFSPMIRDIDTFPYDVSYLPYGEIAYPTNLTELNYRCRSPWYLKKMNVIGDSIVYGSYGNFVNVIKEQLSLSVARNYGIGGCCIASTDQDSQYTPVVLRWDEMDNDADIVIVHAGTNDYSAQVPLGDLTSTDITTFNGALNTIMDGLRQKYPTSLVIFSGILHRFNDSALAIPASSYRAAMEERCLAKHFVYYDGYRWTGFNFGAAYYDHILSNDGLHPNELGAAIFGRKLAGFINWQ